MPALARASVWAALLGSALSIEALFTVGGAKQNPPALSSAHEVVRSIELPRKLPARALDVPPKVSHRVLLALLQEGLRLESRLDIAVVFVELAQGDHVVAYGLIGWPVFVSGIRGDARRNGVQLRDCLAVKCVKRVAVALEERANFYRHGEGT